MFCSSTVGAGGQNAMLQPQTLVDAWMGEYTSSLLGYSVSSRFIVELLIQLPSLDACLPAPQKLEAKIN